MFQLVWCKDPINQSIVAYTSDNSQGVSKSSLLFSSTKVSSPDVRSSYKELLAHCFLDLVKRPPDMAWEVSGPHGPSGPVGFPANFGTSPRGLFG